MTMRIFLSIILLCSACAPAYVASRSVLERLQPDRKMVPARKGCDVCHKIFADTVVYRYNPVNISHKTHARLGIECAFCHRAAPSSTAVDDYLLPAGHGFTQKMSEDAVDGNPCRVCHIYSSPFEKKEGREARCKGCHPSYMADKPLPYRIVKLRTNLKSNHKAHHDRGIGCLRCHVGFDLLESPVQSYVPKMDICYECHKNAGGEKAEGAPEASPLAAAKRLYLLNCSTCHGPDGKGNGPMSAFFRAGLSPRDFTDSAHMSKRTDQQIHTVILKGGLEIGLSEKMPGWEGLLKEDDINLLVKYIRHLSGLSNFSS